MLDNETKKRIDDCRDILVGKLPDPKSQIEQITIALIYKFMDDMDKESIDLGGEVKFFSNDFEKYSWDNLFDTKVSANDMLKLYSESIESMEKNPNIPQLFRDIFKNAYLPYRDPETLKLFLKTIGEFEYTHSEKLGDAFEYLLSVMGSQGDAGQFRTPRHIIDFLVKIVNPSKDDTILDPACGTAGFLISAFKHIKENNQLTPDDMRKVIKNFVGYDISPEMVKLSLVNLYLHGFLDPHIFEYDTLTSEERWDETFDVVLANPPFMTPKGGIRPHKKFSVTSNRSEVLFVDYIAEHLNPKGKAGIIVPEGIIFQSGKAYKELRKMLVENYLYAVVSLPSGVFNPYSGVKTSILLMDKELASKSDKVLFVKIENDGYSLGAQRSEIKGSQLNEAIEIIDSFRNSILEKKEFENTSLAHVVEKEKIAENGEYNLSGERYKKSLVINSSFPIVQLKEIANVVSGQSPKSEFYNTTGDGLPFYQGKTEFGSHYIGKPTKWTTKITKEANQGDILMSVRAPVGPVNFATQNICIGRGLAAIQINSKVLNKYLYYVLKSQEENIIGNGGAVFDSISRKQIEELKIPLPPLSIQEEIVKEIESYQKIIDGAKMVVENYKPQIDIDTDWEIVKLGKEIDFVSGLTLSIPKCESSNGTPIVSMTEIKEDGSLDLSKVRTIKIPKKKYEVLQKGDLLFNWRNGSKHLVGKTALFDEEGTYVFASFCLGIRVRDRLLPKFLWILLNQYRVEGKYEAYMRQNINGLFNREELKILDIPLPSIEIQENITEQIENEMSLVDSNKKLIEIYAQKIKDKISKVWNR